MRTLQKLLEEKLEIQDTTRSIKIDRSHRLGKQHHNQRGKPRPIVAKLRGTKIGISEQFPEETEETRRKLYPENEESKIS
jgi:hypothetical protein